MFLLLFIFFFPFLSINLSLFLSFPVLYYVKNHKDKYETGLVLSFCSNLHEISDEVVYLTEVFFSFCE